MAIERADTAALDRLARERAEAERAAAERAEAERRAWEDARRARTLAAVAAFMKAWPDGALLDEARALQRTLEAEAGDDASPAV